MKPAAVLLRPDQADFVFDGANFALGFGLIDSIGLALTWLVVFGCLTWLGVWFLACVVKAVALPFQLMSERASRAREED